MVQVSSWLCRVPVIKFRKGGSVQHAGSPAAAASSGSSAAAGHLQAAQAQPAAGMSTAINDNELPARYKRQPLSEEEIAYINGGGIGVPESHKENPDPKMLGVLKIPKGVLVKSGQNRPEILSLNIVLQKEQTSRKK